MPTRQNTFLLKGSNVPGKVPSNGDLQLKELALNFADVILYASGTTTNSILPIGWDRIHRTGDTLTGDFYINGFISATTISGETFHVNNYIDFNVNASGTAYSAGRVYFDPNENALSYFPTTTSGDVTINLGQETVIKIINNSGTDILNGQICIINDSSGVIPSIELAISSAVTTSLCSSLARASGVATHDIPNGGVGFITHTGIVRGLTITAATPGSCVFLSDTELGGYKHTLSDLLVESRVCRVGTVITTGVTTSSILVELQNEQLLTSLSTRQGQNLTFNNTATGVIQFGGFSANTFDNRNFDVGIIKGWVVDNTTNPEEPTITYMDYTGSTGVYPSGITLTYLLSATATYIGIDKNYNFYQSTTPLTNSQKRTYIDLGVVVHSNRTNINVVNNQPVVDVDTNLQLYDLMTAIGFFNVSGNKYFENAGANLTFDKTSGYVFKQGSNYVSDTKNPHLKSMAPTSPTTFRYRAQTGETTGDITNINPSTYDIGGVSTPVPSNKFTVQRIYLFSSNLTRIQYGQSYYGSMSEAIEAISTDAFVVESNLMGNGLLRGYLVVREGTTDLTDTTDAKFIEASRFGDTTGAGGGISTTTLQGAYNNSLEPEILIDSTRDALTIQNGSGTDNVTNLLEGKNSGGTLTSFIRADGAISATTYYGDGAYLAGINNYYTTAATLTDKIIYFNRTDALSAYNVSLSSFTLQSEFSGHTGNTTIHHTLTELDGRYVELSGDTMTGNLTLATGTTTIPPLKFQSGDLLMQSIPGVLEYQNDDYYASISSSGGTTGYITVNPPAFSDTYVKTTTLIGANFEGYRIVNPASSIVGGTVYQTWWADNGNITNQRFHIDLGSANLIDRIYYVNTHVSGTYTHLGVKNFTFWGSNSSADFNDLVYANDGTWTQITGLSQTTFDEHIAADVEDKKYITLTANNAYRYYAFKFADLYVDDPTYHYMGMRHLELQYNNLPTYRKGIVLNDGTKLTSTYIPVATTNGRVVDSKISQTYDTTSTLINIVGNNVYTILDSNNVNGQCAHFFRKNGVTKWQFGTDAANNGTNDFYIFDQANTKHKIYMNNSNVYIGNNAYVTPALSIFDDGNVSIGNLVATSKLHIDAGTATASALKFTANATTGQLATDGCDFGIDASGNMELRQRENLDTIFYTNNIERARINGSGTTIFAAGSTTKAPLKLTSGELLTTPEVGAVEFHDDNYYLTIPYIDVLPLSGSNVNTVKSTTRLAISYPHYAVSLTTNLRSGQYNSIIGWQCNYTYELDNRFHIDMGYDFLLKRIYYENYHDTGTATSYGAKNFTLWGSNNISSFNDLTYSADTGWVQITGLVNSNGIPVTSFTQHIAVDSPDPQYIYLPNNNIIYRYYAFKIANNWGDLYYVGLRRLVLGTLNRRGTIALTETKTTEGNIIVGGPDGILKSDPLSYTSPTGIFTPRLTTNGIYSSGPLTIYTVAQKLTSAVQNDSGYDTAMSFGGCYNNPRNAYSYMVLYGEAYGSSRNGSWELNSNRWVYDYEAGYCKLVGVPASNASVLYKNGGSIFMAGGMKASPTTGGTDGDIVLAHNYTRECGFVGVRLTKPTANLHIGSGSITNAPLKIDSGDLLTLPEAGAIEFHDDDYYAGISSTVNKTGIYNSFYPPYFEFNGWIKSTSYLASYSPEYTCNPAISLIGVATNTSWYSALAVITNQRFHITLGKKIILTRIYYENSHSTGTLTDRGVKDFTLWGSNSLDAFNMLTYSADTNWTQITGLTTSAGTSTSAFTQHISSNTPDPQYIYISGNTIPYQYYAFKFVNNYGNTSYMGVRRIELQSDAYHTRKGIVLNDGTNLTSGKIPIATTNGRLIDSIITQTETSLTINGTSGSSVFETDGTLRFDGNATVYDDFVASLNVPAAGGAAPDIINHTIFAVPCSFYCFDGNSTEERLSTYIEMYHGYKNGSTIEIHAHAMPTTNNSGNLVWYFDYFISPINSAPISGGTLSALITISANTQWRDYTVSIGEISYSGLSIGDFIVGCIRRTPTGADTYPDDVALKQVAAHCEIDTIGSRQRYIK